MHLNPCLTLLGPVILRKFLEKNVGLTLQVKSRFNATVDLNSANDAHGSSASKTVPNSFDQPICLENKSGKRSHESGSRLPYKEVATPS